MWDGDLEAARDVVLGPASSVGLELAKDVGMWWTRDGGFGFARDSLDVAGVVACRQQGLLASR